MASTPISVSPTPNPITQNASGPKAPKPAAIETPMETPKLTVPQGLEQDTVSLNTSASQSAATEASQTAGETATSAETKAAGKTGQSAEKAVQDTAKASKPFYQPIIDFFQKIGQKIMDIFTPTSKEALEKAVLKAEHKAGVYQGRLLFNQQTLEQEGLSDIQKELLEKDSQKIKDKLAKLETQYSKLTGKLEKLGASGGETAATQATKKAGAEATSTAGEAAESASKTATKSVQQNTAEGLEKAAKETTEALEPEKAAQEFLEGLSKQLDEISTQLKEKAPQYVDEFTNIIKKILR